MASTNRFLTFREWPRLTAPLARTEVLAGLTVALVMIPQAVAYAGLAGMPLVTGLYTCLIPALLAVLFHRLQQFVNTFSTPIGLFGLF